MDNGNVYSEEDSLVQHQDARLLLADPRNEPVAKCLGGMYVCCFVIALSPCIVAIIIAADYASSSSICLDSSSSYVIALDIWLYVAGCLSIVVVLSCVYLNCYQTFFASFDHYTKISSLLLSRQHFLFQIANSAFHLSWACIGLYMYTVQMSEECQLSDIGTMVLLFAILELLNACCISCCAMCVVSNKDHRLKLPALKMPNIAQRLRQETEAAAQLSAKDNLDRHM